MTTPGIYKWPDVTAIDDLFRLKRNSVMLLLKRGVNIPKWQKEILKEPDETSATYVRKRDIFEEKMNVNKESYYSNMTELYKGIKTDENGKRVRVEIFIYFGEGKDNVNFNEKQVDTFISTTTQRMPKGGTAIFVVPKKLSADKLRKLTETNLRKYEIYTRNMLLVDRNDHVMSSEVQVMTKEEKEKFFLETGTVPSMLPKYKKFSQSQKEWNDPTVLYENLKSGDLVRLTQKNDYTNQVSTQNIYYRIVK